MILSEVTRTAVRQEVRSVPIAYFAVDLKAK
jgi:hypothetical protein